MESEDLDAVLERWLPTPRADVGTAHMEAPVDREVLARLRRLQGEDEPHIVAKLASKFLEDARSRLEVVEELGRVERALEEGVQVPDNRFQVKWFQPDKPSTCSSLRSKTTSDWVISPISVRGTSTLFASASRTGPGAQISSS